MKIGKLMIWCEDCNVYFKMNDSQFNWTCPRCGRFITKLRCTRCGHEWEARNHDKLPKICASPRCHSPYWCRERVKEKK